MGMQQCTCVSGASWQAGSRFTTAQTQDMASWHVWHKRCALQFWMVRVWEDSCCSHSSCEWQGGRIDCDSSHCGLGADLFLPPGPCSSSTQRKRARCHLSTNGGFLGGRTEFSQKKTFFLSFTAFLAYPHNSAGSWRDVPSQLSSDAGLIPRAWGQDVGLEDKPHFSMHVSAASTHFASALTFVIQRAFIHKQLCELRCCCITGSVSP